MEDVLGGSAGAVFIFFYLLPGLLGTSIYDFLVEGEPRSNVQRIIFALSLTLLSALTLRVAFNVPMVPAVAVTKDADAALVMRALLERHLLFLTAISAGLGILLAAANNHGLILAVFRVTRLTYKVSAADVWQDTFYKFRGYWVRVTFDDGRILVGWPRYFSGIGKPRELFVADATWWLPADEGSQPRQVDEEGPGVYIADFSKVTTISLLK